MIGLLHTTTTGPRDAPVLVLGGSLGTTGEMWAPQVAPLSADVRVVTFDHRGHGASPVPPGPYTIDDLGRDLLDTLESAGIHRFSYAGLSLGGTVGIWLAAHAPERVERLALLCTSAHYGNPPSWRERAETVRREGTAAVTEAVLGRWFTARTARERPETVDWLRQMLLASPDEGYAACCEALADLDLRDSLGDIVAPTLIVAGEADPSTPADPHALTLAGGIASARLVVLADTAHLANVERPGEVTALLRGAFSPGGANGAADPDG